MRGPSLARRAAECTRQSGLCLLPASCSRSFLEEARGTAQILTLAPELPGALDLISAARQAGLVVSLGHTDATYEQAQAAIEAGASHAAHVFNAMRPFSHRGTGVIGAVLTSPKVSAELIADGVHVDEAAMRMLVELKTPERVILVSDGISATGMPDGKYQLGMFEVKVSGGVARNAEGKLAGSTLTLDRALRNMVALGVPLASALRMVTANPARQIGLGARKGVLAPGADADLVFLDDKLEVSGVMTRGAGLALALIAPLEFLCVLCVESRCLNSRKNRFERQRVTENAEENLFVQGNIQFGGKQVGIKRAAGKKAVADLDRGHFPAALIDLEHEILGIDILVDIHFDEVHSAILQKSLGAVAIDAPARAIHCDFFHSLI